MRVAYVCFYHAYPPTSGAASVTYHCAKHTAGDRFLLQMGPADRQELTPDGVAVTTLGAPSGRWGKIAGLGKTISRMVRRIAEIGPDVIVLEGASWVVYHYLLLRQLRRQPGSPLKKGTGTSRPLRLAEEPVHRLGASPLFQQAAGAATIVYHAHNVEYVLRRQKSGPLVTAITRWVEGRLLRAADQALAVSEVDQEQFQELYGVRPGLLPNGVDLGTFDAVTDNDLRQARTRFGLTGDTVLFMGGYWYRPNREAIDFLVHDVFPPLVARHPAARLVIAGEKAPYERPWLVDLGTVPYEALPAVVRACRIGVAPIFSGSGTRLKILEYLAAGLPVVATAKGAEGLDLTDGRHLLLAETAQEFAAAVSRLLLDRDLASACASQGQFAIRERFAYEAILGRFQALLEREGTHA